MMTTHLSAQLQAIIASAKIQLLIVAKRPMNIATGIITPWMFLSLFLIPRIGNLNQDQITYAISATITASFWAASIWSGAGIIRREKWMGTLGHTLSGLLSPMAAIFAKMLGAVAYDVTLITISTTSFCLIFRIPFHPTHPFLLAAGIILVAVFGVCSSILIAGLLINSRNPFHLTNAFGTPMLLLGGLLIPPSYLPPVVSWVSALINLYWLRQFLSSLTTTPDWSSLLIGCLVSICYLLGAWLCIRHMVTRAKVRGTFEFT
ncbi:MAG: ABC transporter permease [Corynebacterium matruchotii]|jgi:hypothetical protein|uniref:ABC transporter permease n=1 Tax=Corynebacterium matruchotii TaxID=43768 RepID=UPI0028F0FD04|nr:ABC transporter permease [Corynebacterium matruchotii]